MPMSRVVSLFSLLIVILLLQACASLDEKATETDAEEEIITQEETFPRIDLSDATAEPEVEIKDTTPPPFWDHVRQGFQLPEKLSLNERVQPQLKWHLSHLDFLQRVTARAEPYLYYIHSEIERRGLPSELLLLPIIESAYVPDAYSRSRAAGIWQFIPSTGRYFGLKQTWWYDGRRDIIQSTDAALDYLEKLNKHFDGDWLLALAAYNGGEGTIMRAQKRNANKGLPTDFWSLKLRRETMEYVPKLLAVAELVRHSADYYVELWPIDNAPVVRQVDLDGQIELDVAAGLAGINRERLHQLNPGFQRWATSPDGPYHLLLPIEKADQFEKRLAQLPVNKRVRWNRHRVREFETLSHIAVKYKTRLSVIRKANRLKGNTIRVGQHLLVPQGVTKLAQLDKHDVPQDFVEPVDGKSYQHRVTEGDTYWSLSKRYGVSMTSIASWNQLNTDDPLMPGQLLTLWLNTPPETIALMPPKEKQQTRSVNYSVRKGDTLYSISKRFALKIADIRRWNALRDSLLQPGQSLTLHVDINQQYRGIQ